MRPSEGAEPFSILEGLATYGGQTSSSCRGLVAFGRQMGALWVPKWGPGPNKYIYSASTNTNTYIVQI